MKKIILSILLIISYSGFSQTFKQVELDSITNNIVFTEIVLIDSATQSTLYSKSKEWFTMNFKSSNDVIQLDDKEAGKLIGKSWQNIFLPTAVGEVKAKIFYTITIQVKNNKYKYSISNIKFKSYPDQYEPNPKEYFAEDWITEEKIKETRTKARTKYKIETLRVVNELSESLKKHMATNNKNDW